ncbi:uncharacterized protein METZ01_LOCUS14902 [marine metagenome]|uniref:Uncharacterized protein n=1 Tax=marine metagenome TaxID=408172 RepID=A0A381P750_9ZZZZ
MRRVTASLAAAGHRTQARTWYSGAGEAPKWLSFGPF